MKDDRTYVQHILECIEKINRYTHRDRDLFFSDEMVQDAVLRNLQTLAESAKNLSEDVKNSAPPDQMARHYRLSKPDCARLPRDSIGARLERYRRQPARA